MQLFFVLKIVECSWSSEFYSQIMIIAKIVVSHWVKKRTFNKTWIEATLISHMNLLSFYLKKYPIF